MAELHGLRALVYHEATHASTLELQMVRDAREGEERKKNVLSGCRPCGVYIISTPAARSAQEARELVYLNSHHVHAYDRRYGLITMIIT